MSTDVGKHVCHYWLM